MSADDDYRAWQRANEAPTVYSESTSLSNVLAERDMEIARLTAELDARKAAYTVYLGVSSTGEGMPTGTWRADEPEPEPTVDCMGDPSAVRGLMTVIERGKAAETEVARLTAERDEAIGLVRDALAGNPLWRFAAHAFLSRRARKRRTSRRVAEHNEEETP